MFEQAYTFVLEQIGKNDFIAGGAVLGALAFVLNYLRTVPLSLMRWSKLAFVTQVDIPDRSETFQWITEWLAQHKYSNKAKRITIEAKGNTNKKATTTPAPGRHLVWWNRTPLLITRVRNEGTGDNAHRAFREGWKITMIGKRPKVDAFIEECKKCSYKEKDKYIQVRESDHGYWDYDSRAKRRRRSMESVILPEGMRESLLKDLSEFTDSKDWYNNMNIPWRRGYLLTGPPGNGKSSIITAVASEIDFDIHVVNLKKISEDELVGLVTSIKERSILLLEDIDCAFEEREGKQGIALSTLLNCLDGVSATEGRVVFMTTNHPEKLDPALIRPGRIDLSLTLPNATHYQIAKLYERFHVISSTNSADSNRFADLVVPLDISMARLQGYLLQYRHSAIDALHNTGELLDA